MDESGNPHAATGAPVDAPGTAGDPRPGLLGDRAFWNITSTQFLGAFNDNLFKQTLLLMFVAIPVAGQGAGGASVTLDLQWLATFLFSLPFILFSGYAGYLSDRFSKRTVIVSSKVAEIVVMAAGAGLFALYAAFALPTWLIALFCAVLFFMGAQSAFFGPGKYGILPELFRDRDLPQANGLILMTTFLAIIFGSALAGLLTTAFPTRFWIVGIACVAVAAVGTWTAMGIRWIRPANHTLAYDTSSLSISHEIRSLLRADRELLAALAVSSVFWLVAALVQMAVNALGKIQLGQDNLMTSLLVAMISVGIAAGSLVAGVVSKDRFNTRIMAIGLWGLVVFLVLLALPGFDGGQHSHLLGYWGSMIVLVILGACTGLFAVPLQVFLQARPPAGLKGRMIAAQNLCNWIGITLSAGIYFVVDSAVVWAGWPKSTMFAFAAMLMLAVALTYHPHQQKLE